MAENLLGANIQRLREAKGLSRKDLGVLSGLDYNHIYLIEEGERKKLTPETLVRLAAALDCTVDELLVEVRKAVREDMERLTLNPSPSLG